MKMTDKIKSWAQYVKPHLEAGVSYDNIPNDKDDAIEQLLSDKNKLSRGEQLRNVTNDIIRFLDDPNSGDLHMPDKAAEYKNLRKKVRKARTTGFSQQEISDVKSFL